MNKRWLRSVVLSLLLVTGLVLAPACASKPAPSVTQVTAVSATQAQSLIQQNQGNPQFVILDVRTPAEFAEGHIAGAVNLNYLDNNFKTELGKLNRDDTYLVHCRTGGRSDGAVGVMQERGVKQVYHMTGGIIEWQDQGLPTVQ